MLCCSVVAVWCCSVVVELLQCCNVLLFRSQDHAQQNCNKTVKMPIKLTFVKNFVRFGLFEHPFHHIYTCICVYVLREFSKVSFIGIWTVLLQCCCTVVALLLQRRRVLLCVAVELARPCKEFSNVSSTVISHNTLSSELTFAKF